MAIDGENFITTVNFDEHRLKVYGHIEDDGIGSYEFWGQKGFDKKLACYPDEVFLIFKNKERLLSNKILDGKWDIIGRLCDEIFL